MLKPLEFKGYFFLPENPEEELPGILKFDKDDGLQLDLFGQFNNYKKATSKDNNIILGFTSNGKKITLLNCYETSKGMSLPGFATSSFISLYLFIGKHYNLVSEISFDSCSIEYADFNHWLDISGFDRVRYDDEIKEVNIKYKQPEKIKFDLKDNWQAEIEFVFSRPRDYFEPVSQATIKQEPVFTLIPVAKSSFGEYQTMFSTFSAFLALNYFSYPIIESVKFYDKILEADDDDSNFDGIELYFSSKPKIKKYQKHVNRQDFLLQYKDYFPNFNERIKNWYSLNDKIEASINILTECLMNRTNAIEFHFLGLVQALENMHRRLINRRGTLNDRLVDIVTNLPSRTNYALLSDEADFTRRVTDNRNFYTHLSGNNAFVPASLGELFVLSEKLKIILMASILQKLGLANEEVDKIIIGKGVWLYNHIVKYDKVREFINKSD